MTMQAAITDLDEALKTLDNPVRRRILAQLKHPEQNFPNQDHPYDFGVCAGKIDDAFGLSQSTISAHLAVLQHAGLITAKRTGQWIFYKRNEPAIAAFLAHMEKAL